MVRCENMAGKVVQTFSLYEDGPYGPEINIEFTDGTVFNSCLKTSTTLEAKLIRNANGVSEVVEELSTPASR